MHTDTAALRAELIGALVGMARAADPHPLSETGRAIAVEGLALSADANADPAALEAAIARAHAEKYALSPDCRACQHPCARTADFDLRELDLIRDAEVRALREALRNALQVLAVLAARLPATGPARVEAEAFFLDGLMDLAHAFAPARLEQTLARAAALQARCRTALHA